MTLATNDPGGRPRLSPDPRRQSEHGARDVAPIVQRTHECGADGYLADALRELIG